MSSPLSDVVKGYARLGSWLVDRLEVNPMGTAAAQMRGAGDMPSFGGATAWLNSSPLTAAELRGKVVLVNFWTLTCINWLRQLPHVRAWAEKYKDQGLVVIGVHSPEFVFEQDVDAVRDAAKAMNVGYPVAVEVMEGGTTAVTSGSVATPAPPRPGRRRAATRPVPRLRT